MREQVVDGGERDVLRVLASGRLAEVAAVLSKHGRRDLVGLLAVTDARARGLAVDVPEVEAVVERIEGDEAPGSRLRIWAHAVLAERLLLELDGSAFTVAQRALDEIGRAELPPRPPLALRYGRARVSRVASLSWLFAPGPEGLALHRRLRDDAVAELLACNFIDEVHVTRGLDAGLTVAVAEEDIIENYARLHDARVAVDDDPASMWPATLDVLVAIVAFEAGDLRAALGAFERLEAVPNLHARALGLASFGRAFFRIITGGASPPSVAAVEKALDEVRRRDPRIAQAWHAQLAQTLADMRSPWAEHFARLQAELPPVGPVHALGQELLGMRVAALAGDPVGADAAITRLRELDTAGYRRRSARQALRLAHDLARGGDPTSARRVHAWGIERLPAHARLTVWERWWVRPVRDRPPPDRSPFRPGGVIPSLWERWSDLGTGAGWGSDPAGAATRPAGSADPAGPPGGSARAGGARDGGAAGGGADGLRAGPAGTGQADGTQPGPTGLPSGQPRTSRVELRVLTPALELEIGGEPRPVRETTARLLLALAIAHPQPLHVEQVAAVLWPDADLVAARRRLNTVLYRARQLTAPGAVVRRAGDLVSFAPASLDVDLLAYRQALGGDPPARARALAGVRGNLCQAQFPYDEPFLDERHRFIGTWLEEARALVAAGELEPQQLRVAATALGLDPHDLAN